MTFATDIAKVPYTPRGTDAAGFLAPMVRAYGHILFATALSAQPAPTGRGAETAQETTNAEILSELVHAKDHWNVINWNEALSAPTVEVITNIGAAITSATEEYAAWDAAAKTTNLRDLAHRTATLATVLDRECVGLPNSDPGFQL